ncbi:hypothetical protein DB30_04896 [Enhygromyxa salina]|uniref:J domain-containing protein n=1 Tax=Enhygromyxa salina TaxID=215803 RepID=A0A0C1ZY46_9BACT|nr:J domain-containing protein [Enhygromyxa salina]KIG16178.1 hypothetical protein DB30_04896 [Enhygromyxa salina]
MEAPPDPFRVLGLEPTLERAAIKRAYFGLLRHHSPHADPEGFRRIRDAYEQLSGDGLAAAWSVAELDLERELQAIEAELSVRIAAMQAAVRTLEAERRTVTGFTAILSLTLDDAVARCEPPSPKPAPKPST